MRREFLGVLGSVAAGRSAWARAQQPAKLPTIGVLGGPTATDSVDIHDR